MAEKCSILFQFRVYLGRVEQKERKKMLFRNIKGGNILGNSYKICFLGYRKLREMAQQVIDKLNYQDTTVVMKECAIETLEQVVNEADSEGCQVFVAGSANAEEFKQRFSEHLVELHIDMSDYVYCLCRARDMGARRVGVTIYRKNRQMNFEALQELAGIPIEPIYFESEPELTYLLEHTSCDCVIGASLTVEVAERLGLPCILIYDGEYTIRTSIERARVLAAELQASSRKEAITDALVRDVPAGIIITDENDRITTFNQQAKALVGLQGRKLRGLELGELVPPLSYNTFYKSGQIKTDHIHLLNGTMVRCVQTQLQQGNRYVGMLVTMLPDSSRRKKTADTQKFVARHQWKDLVGDSVAITQAMTAGKQLAQTEEHLMILGESGTGKSFFAQCIHQSSPHASEPFVVINATVVGQDASRTLFGSEEGANDHAGLFELAGNGTIVLQGLGGASESFFACLRQVLVYHSFFSVGGTTLKVFQARIITLLEPEETGRFPRELREMLSVFSLTFPPLRERGDDVIELFRIFAVRGEAGTVSLRGQKELWKELDELLRFYAWPTNLITLSAVVKRYVYLYRQAMNPSPGVKRQLLIKAIGEDELLEQLRQEYPALQDPAGSTPEAIVEGVAEMKRLLKYNDNTIADKLGLGRTTLWRMQKKSGAAKAKKEE